MQEDAGSVSQNETTPMNEAEKFVNQNTTDNKDAAALVAEAEVVSDSTENPAEEKTENPAEEKSNTDESENVEEDDDEDEEDEASDAEKSEEARQQRLAELREDMSDENKAAFLEAVLFLESEPQPPESLSRITQLSVEEVNSALEILKAKYAKDESGLELTQIIGGWILIPKKDYFMFVRERYGKKNEGRLSKAAIETLTIIAYSQPITRAEIQNLRHVNVDNMMRVLIERKFIKEVGKKDIPGKPVMYGTTKEFLEFFHLQSIADLPRLEEKESEVFELAR